MAIYVGRTKYSLTKASYRGFWSVVVYGFKNTKVSCGTTKVIGDEGYVVFRIIEPGIYDFSASLGEETETKQITLVDGNYYIRTNMFIGMQLLEYVDSIYGNQYIDTGIAINTLTNPCIEAEFQMLSKGDYDWFGGSVMDTNTIIWNHNNAGNIQYIRWGTMQSNAGVPLSYESGKSVSNFNFNDKIQKLKVDNNNGRPLYYVDDVLIATQTNTPSFNSLYTILVCRARNFLGSSRFKSFKIYNDGELLIDLVPAQVEETICMFDNVSMTPFYNQGTGDFTPGPIKE